jgi:hypothetical protein
MNIRRLRARLERVEARANSLSQADIYVNVWWSDPEDHPMKEYVEALRGTIPDVHQHKLDRERELARQGGGHRANTK